MHLEHAAFESDPTLWSMPWRQVQSTKPCPAWYSLGSTNWMVPFGDLMMLRDIADLGLPYEAVGRAWLGCPLKLENMIAFKYEKLARLNGWYLGLKHLGTSIVLAWPLTRCQMPGCDGVFYYEPVFSVKEPVGIFISEVSDLQACALQVRSPLWQWNELVQSRGVLPPCSRLFQQRDPEPLCKVLARGAYFDMNLSTIHALGKHRGCKLVESFGSGEPSACVIGVGIGEPCVCVCVCALFCSSLAEAPGGHQHHESWGLGSRQG